MIQVATALILLFAFAGYSEPPVRRPLAPERWNDPTVAPHFPRLPRLSTAEAATRSPNDVEPPNFLQHLTPVHVERNGS